MFVSIPNHLLAWGRDQQLWEAAGWDHADVAELPLERTLLVKRCKIWPYEMVFRAHIGGSVWMEYQEKGTAAGVRLPSGLRKWERLSHPIFTPTTKSQSGHDIAITVEEYKAQTGEQGMKLAGMCADVFQQAYEYALEHGLIILDTKFEVSDNGMLVDEVLTPDSSRITLTGALEAAVTAGKDPAFHDKEPVRIWVSWFNT